jgi:hypothetical protein
MCRQMTIAVTKLGSVIVLAINTLEVFMVFTAGANHD